MSQQQRDRGAAISSQTNPPSVGVLYSAGRPEDGLVLRHSDHIQAPPVLPFTFAKSPPIYLSPTEFDMTDLTVSSRGVISTSARHSPVIVVNGQPQRMEVNQKQSRDDLLKKMHLNLSALEENFSEEEEEDMSGVQTPLQHVLHMKKKPISHRLSYTFTRLKIVLVTVLFLFLVAIALLIVCVVAAYQ